MAVLLLNAFLSISIRKKEGRYMLVVYALGAFFNNYKSIYILCHFMRSIRMNGLKTEMLHILKCIFDA